MKSRKDTLLFSATKQKCHCEPARRLVWQSPKNIKVLFGTFPFHPGDSHASVRTGSE